MLQLAHLCAMAWSGCAAPRGQRSVLSPHCASQPCKSSHTTPSSSHSSSPLSRSTRLRLPRLASSASCAPLARLLLPPRTPPPPGSRPASSAARCSSVHCCTCWYVGPYSAAASQGGLGSLGELRRLGWRGGSAVGGGEEKGGVGSGAGARAGTEEAEATAGTEEKGAAACALNDAAGRGASSKGRACLPDCEFTSPACPRVGPERTLDEGAGASRGLALRCDDGCAALGLSGRKRRSSEGLPLARAARGAGSVVRGATDSGAAAAAGARCDCQRGRRGSPWPGLAVFDQSGCTRRDELWFVVPPASAAGASGGAGPAVVA